MNARWTPPNWCSPCGGYRPRDHDCARQRHAGPPAPRENIEAPEPAVTDPKYVAGWRAGYEAAMRDQAGRTVA